MFVLVSTFTIDYNLKRCRIFGGGYTLWTDTQNYYLYFIYFIKLSQCEYLDFTFYLKALDISIHRERDYLLKSVEFAFEIDIFSIDTTIENGQ